MKTLFILLTAFFTATLFGQTKQADNLSQFVPKGYVIFDTINGDLNKDSLEDIVLIIKGTDKSKFVKHEYRGELDRNRRGIVVLFKQKEHYKLAVKNYDCFSSENEDGGAYFQPELDIEVIKGNLRIHYAHGRYGYWRYAFRFQNSDFELIGYDESNGGAVVQSKTSINFLTKKKLEKENINKDDEEADEVFKETWKNIKIDKLIKLSEIVDFDDLEMSYDE